MQLLSKNIEIPVQEMILKSHPSETEALPASGCVAHSVSCGLCKTAFCKQFLIAEICPVLRNPDNLNHFKALLHKFSCTVWLQELGKSPRRDNQSSDQLVIHHWLFYLTSLNLKYILGQLS